MQKKWAHKQIETSYSILLGGIEAYTAKTIFHVRSYFS